MRSPRPGSEHQQAVSRRLAALGAELAAVRGDEAGVPPEADGPPDTHTRIRPGRLADWMAAEGWSAAGDPADEAGPAPAADPAGAVPLPRPGRHAARRGPAGLLARFTVVRGAARPALALGPGAVAAVAVLLAVGLAVTAWWAVQARSDPLPVVVTDGAVPVVTPVSAPVAAAGASARVLGGAPDAAEVVVDVAGKVRRPGLVVLEPGARVADALKAAGGARRGVDLSSLNLARLLVDGEQVLVGVRAPAGAPPAVPVGSSVPALVNINTASATELETLPEVGPVTAQAIIGWRLEHGGFATVDDLLDVDGIGEVTLARLTPLVTL